MICEPFIIRVDADLIMGCLDHDIAVCEEDGCGDYEKKEPRK
jgi:hypothetical protein